MFGLTRSKSFVSTFLKASRYFSQAQSAQSMCLTDIAGGSLFSRNFFPKILSIDLHKKKMDTPQTGLPPRGIYLDTQATTPMDFRVLDAMLPYMTTLYGNPHSKSHEFGWEAEKATEDARAKVASLIGADPKEIVFLSGATEANNFALKGLAKFYKKKKHIVTTLIVKIREYFQWLKIINVGA